MMTREDILSLICGASVAGMISAALLGWWWVLGLSTISSITSLYAAIWPEMWEEGDR